MKKQSAQIWAKRIREANESGLSHRAYCEREGIKLSTFYGWKARLQKLLPELKDQNDKNKELQPSRFVEAILPFEPKPERLTLKVNERYCLELESGFDEPLLFRTLKVLAKL